MTARSIQVTLGAGATQISATPAYFNQMIVQNNSAAVVNLGDSTVSATTGISLPASAAQTPVVIGPFSGQQGMPVSSTCLGRQRIRSLFC